VVALTNADRKAAGISTLQEDPLLDLAAQKKANDMAARGYFSHLSPEGQAPWQWLSSVGYYFQRAGENLALDFSDAKSLESAWMQSPMHRANLLKDNYTRVGVGIAHGMYNGKQSTFIVQFFATPYGTATALASR
jgi:uncharacterized protein YkwD